MILPRLARAAALALLILPAAAHADMTVDGTGEPAYTNSANNTQWVRWNGVTGGQYRLSVDYYANNALVKNEGPYSMPTTGTSWINWSGVAATPLTEGSQYGICARGQWTDAASGGIWFNDGFSSCTDATQTGRRAYTTIDRTKPTVALSLAGGAEFAKSPALAVGMDFADNLAGPFPANFLCIQSGVISGGTCDSSQGHIYTHRPECSQPATGGRETHFDCSIDVSASDTPAPDGPVSVCAIAADAAIPDNPNSSDQRGSAAQANLSAPSCDTVLLDRTKPDLSVNASAVTDIKAGDTLTFDTVGADALSGIKNGYAWTFGDGGKASGRTVSHAFATPGTYTVSLKVSDTAGTVTTATKKLTVGAAGTPVPPVDAPATNTIAVTAPAQVAVPATGNGKVNVTLTPSSAGRVTFTLLRGTTQVAIAGTAVAAGKSSYGLRLPAGALAGEHTLRVAYTPTGRAVINKVLKTTLTSATPALADTARVLPGEAKVAKAGLHRVLP